MTPEEFINLAKTCADRAELLEKMGGFAYSKENVIKYINPWCRAARLRPGELDLFFARYISGQDLTLEEFVKFAETSSNLEELLDKIGGFAYSKENVNKYVVPWRRAAKLRSWELDLLFAQNVLKITQTPLPPSATPLVTPTPTPVSV